MYWLDVRFHPYTTPNTSKSSSSPSSTSVNDISVQSDQHPPLTSSPCSSSIDESTTNVSNAALTSFQSEQIYSTKYHNDDNDESVCSSKENFAPISYYTDSASANIESINEYQTMSSGLYCNTSIQSNEQLCYSSKLKDEREYI